MERYKDLTYYNRFHFERAKNIGFDIDCSLRKECENKSAILLKLTNYLKYPLNTIRSGISKVVTIDGTEYTIGYSEIRVINKNGDVFAAPDSVLFVISEGYYYPPQEFIDAVMEGLDPESKQYQDYLTRYKPEYCWGESNEYVEDVIWFVNKISEGNLPELKEKIEKDKRKINIVTGNGSLLNEAIARGKENIVDYLIDERIDIENFEGVELLTAIEHGMKSIVKKLLSNNIPVKLDRPRNNPLFFAIGKNQNEIAKMLFEERKDMVQIYTTEYVQNCNILQWTKLCKNEEFLSFLLRQ